MTIEVKRAGVILAVSDFARSLAFYRDRLGFEVEAIFAEPSYAILVSGATRISLAEQGHPAEDCPGVVMTVPADRSQAAAMLVLEVPDCHAAYEALQQAGVPFLREPYAPPWGGARCFA
ncbi:MAG: VOC family protein, partial [Solirubrobacteraceae bacterium]